MDLTQWENVCQSFLRARQPGLLVNSIEEQRVMASIIRVAQWFCERGLGLRSLIRWSAVSTQEINVLKPNEALKKQPDHLGLFATLARFISPEPRGDETLDDHGRISPVRREILVLTDVEGEVADANARRLLREVLWKIRGTQQVIFIIGKPFSLPAELAPEFATLPFELPTAKDIEKSLLPVVAQYKAAKAYEKLVIDEKVVTPLARAAAGLTETEARGILGLAIARHEALDSRAVELALKEKAAIVRRSNVLEYRTCQGGLGDVGGLEHLKQWVKSQDNILNDASAAAAHGLRMPSGLLMLGPPGCGKSLTAQMLAAHWQIPLLVFDVGRCFGSLVGESESNIDQMIQLAAACRPATIFLDEMEKALGGSGGEQDGGTTARVTGKLLSWLQDKPEGVFVVATANDVTKFESKPELIRAGRFDLVSFVDLPDLRSRLEILAIHYRKAVQRAQASGKCALAEHLDPAVLMPAAQASKGYSGAELEVAMQTSLRAAFNASPRLAAPTADMLLAAVKAQKPLSVTMAGPIKALRAWAADGRAVAAGATLEDDAKDVAALETLGLPDILSEQKI